MDDLLFVFPDKFNEISNAFICSFKKYLLNTHCSLSTEQSSERYRRKLDNGFALVEFSRLAEENRYQANTFPKMCAIDCDMCAEAAAKALVRVDDTGLS